MLRELAWSAYHIIRSHGESAIMALVVPGLLPGAIDVNEPKMAKAASNRELAAGFQEHLEQTKGHAQRLEQILSSHQQTTRGPKCKGMEGIVAEGAEMIEEEADEEVKDAGLIAAAQRVEHYEMAGYGTARTYAELLGDKEGAKLLGLTLEEERQTDQKLSKLAKSAVNVAAAK
jgi:ferritin-like metal-binding protein YciE